MSPRRLAVTVTALLVAALMALGVLVASAQPLPAQTSVDPTPVPTPTPAQVIEAGVQLRPRPAQTPVTPGIPTRIEIPAVGLSASVIVTGTKDGAMELPGDLATFAWHEDTARPGSRAGSVLLAGHRDDADGHHGEAFKLLRVTPGDRITLTSTTGTTVWRVQSSTRNGKAALPAAVTSTSGPHTLRLVTCGGALVGGHWDSNIVVTALPVRGAR